MTSSVVSENMLDDEAKAASESEGMSRNERHIGVMNSIVGGSSGLALTLGVKPLLCYGVLTCAGIEQAVGTVPLNALGGIGSPREAVSRSRIGGMEHGRRRHGHVEPDGSSTPHQTEECGSLPAEG